MQNIGFSNTINLNYFDSKFCKFIIKSNGKIIGLKIKYRIK